MKDLESRFQKAYEISSSFTEQLPPDIMLKLYAYYKQALGENLTMPSGDDKIRNAFKINALLQASSISKEEAKEEYIKLVEELINKKIN